MMSELENEKVTQEEVTPPETVDAVQPEPVIPKRPVYSVFQEGVAFQNTSPELQYSKYKSEDVDRLTMPSMGPADVMHILSTYTKEVIDKTPMHDVYALGLQTEIGNKYIPSGTKDTFKRNVEKGNLTNDTTFSNEDTGILRLDANAYSKPGVKTSSSRLVSKIKSALGKGEKANVPLYHSGFRITINPPSQSDLLAFQTKIMKDTTEVGRQTVGLVYSNYQAIVHKYFIEMVRDIIESTTLDTNTEEDDVFNYISMLDLNILYLGVMSSFAVSGIEVNISCKNTKILDEEDHRPKCTYVASGVLNPTKMLWLDRGALEPWMEKQLRRKSSGSVSTSEVVAYRKVIDSRADGITWNVPLSDHKVDVTFRVPTVADYMLYANMWIDKVVADVNKAVVGNITNAEREQTVELIAYYLRTSSHNGFIKTVDIDGESITEMEDIMEALSALDHEFDVIDDLSNTILKFIEDASIAIVGITTFECPECRAVQATSGNSSFAEIIPVDMVSIFFDQVDLVIAGKSTSKVKMLKRDQKV